MSCCSASNGACVLLAQQGIGGPCRHNIDCERGRCFVDRTGRVPDGFCALECEQDSECEEGRCLDVEGGRLCFPRCVDACREGWDCQLTPDGRDRVCRVDCRTAGCPTGLRCDFETASCRPPPAQCRYPCGLDEQCLGGRCVRASGDCETSYHCRLGMTCLNQTCVPDEFSPCSRERSCADPQRCVPVTGEQGICLQRCETATDCTAGRICRAELGACYWPLCGDATGNGRLLAECAGGPLGAQLGTCLPFTFAPESVQGAGYCTVAGLAMPGEPCDAQATERTEDAAGILCAPGSVCFGDPDDPDAPGDVPMGRGTCARLCVDNEACGGGERCIQPPPTTGPTDLTAVGLCLPIDCVFGQRDCADGEKCLIYSWTSALGRCVPIGPVPRGSVCQTALDCQGRGVCPTPYPSRCVDVCDPERIPCEEGNCEGFTGWSLGVCR